SVSSLHLNIPSPFFLFHHTALYEISTLSLHDALPILKSTAYFFLEPQEFQALKKATLGSLKDVKADEYVVGVWKNSDGQFVVTRSEEHTSELQSRFDLVCRLLLEKKKICMIYIISYTS